MNDETLIEKSNRWDIPRVGWYCIGCGAILGLLFGYSGPMVSVAILGCASFLLLLMEKQMTALIVVILAQILIPIYVGLPVIPGLPPLPPSLLMALILASISVAWLMLDRRGKLTLDLLPKLLIGIFALSVATGLFSVIANGAIRESVNVWGRSELIPFVVFVATVIIVRSKKQVQLLFNILLLAALLATAYAAIEFGLEKNILIEHFIERQYDNRDIPYWGLVDGESGVFIYRAHSVFTNPLFFGTFLSMVVPYPIIRYVKGKGSSSRFYYLGASFLCLTGVILTFSRGPMLGAFGSLVAFSIILKPLRKLIFIFLIALLIGGAFAWPWIGDKVTDRFADTDNVSIRIKFWEAAIHMYLDHPLTGVGPGNYPQFQLQTNRKYKIGPFLEGDGEHIEAVRTADSLYFQAIAERGTLGFIFAISKYLLLGIMTISIVKTTKDRNLWLLSISTLMAICAYLINGLTITASAGYSITIFLEMFFAFTISLYMANKKIEKQ